MIALGPYADFILLSYAAAILVVAGLVLWIVLDHRHVRRQLAALEASGIGRRSARPAARLAETRPETAA